MTDYKQIFEECYQELSPEAQMDIDNELKKTSKLYRKHATNYTLSRRGFNSGARRATISGIGKEGAKELITALIMKGYL
jgi:hypothetical protein